MTATTALVTGANGFLGRHLIARLRASGHAVVALVRRSSDLGPGVSTMVADIRDAEAVRKTLHGRQFELVFHLAAAGVSPDDREPASMFATNATATGDMVDVCALAGARAFVFAGSCSEYDAADQHEPIAEHHRLTRDNLYGASKVAGGFWGRALARKRRMTFCWLRLFGAYGPGESSSRLIPYLAERLARDQPVDLTPGNQLRDLMHVDDVASALVLAGELAAQGHEGPYNVCSGLGIAIGDVARMVADQMRKPQALLRFGTRPYRPDEPICMVGDPSRFRQLTGFSPRIALEDGVGMTLKTLGCDR